MHGQTDAANACYQQLAASDDPYLRAEGEWGLGQFAQANTDFRLAVGAHDASAHDRVRWGMLLQARFNDADAEGLFQEALQRDPKSAEAYLGLALVSADGFDGKALDYTRKALSLDPQLAEADVLLANLDLEDADPAAAAQAADAALAAQADDLDAMAVHAAIAVLALQPPGAWMARITAINPHYGAADAEIASQLVLNRRYQEGIDYYRQAVALDPQLWDAHSQLGVNLLRLGDDADARTELELAYAHDYRDAATVNSLRLLDTLQKYTSVHDGDILLRFDPKESAVLAPYFEDLVRRAMAHYSSEYGFTPAGTIEVEAFSSHDDFAVASVGLPGLGALGVTFGQVVTMDSPSARPPGEFDWADTLWHELDHVYVLTMTHHLVPRWFAEGLAVHEEGQASPAWTQLTPDDLAAVRDHQLLPVADLDRGFVHPTYPNQVLVSYYQASRICDYIQEKWGAAKLVEMVHDFAVPTTTPAVIQSALHLTPAAFDTAFQAWLAQQLGPLPANFNTWHDQLKQLVAMAGKADPQAVVTLGEKVRALYPEYVFDANPYGYLVPAYLALGRKADAEATLAEYERHGGTDLGLLQQLASLQPPAAAAATLDRINDIYPLKVEPHTELGQLDLQLNDNAAAIREFRAAVALQPLDQAGAQYHLAQAYFAAGQLDAAQDAVIAALVAAHDYQPAQDLLVKIMAQKGHTP